MPIAIHGRPVKPLMNSVRRHLRIQREDFGRSAGWSQQYGIITGFWQDFYQSANYGSFPGTCISFQDKKRELPLVGNHKISQPLDQVLLTRRRGVGKLPEDCVAEICCAYQCNAAG